jgi:beta-lactamase class A
VLDVLITGGEVYDGTGVVIDASGKAVCPGFINILSHSYFSILHDPRSLGELTQGVTTELCSAAAAYDGCYASHIRSEGERLHEALAEFLAIVRDAGLRGEVVPPQGGWPVALGQDGRCDRDDRAGPGGRAGSAAMTGAISQETAMAAIGAVAGRSTGAVGLAARHLETGDTLTWRADEEFRTASLIKTAIHVAVMRRARLGAFSLDDQVELADSDLVGGSGVLAVLRPGLRCTVSDLCTLMIVVSDNTATNMLIDLCGGVDAVNDDLARLGFPGIRLNHRLGYPPPSLVTGVSRLYTGSGTPLAMATPAAFCELMEGLHAGTVVAREASAEIIAVLQHQQHQALFPRAFVDIPEPGDPPGPGCPWLAHKTGYVDGWLPAEAEVLS